MNGSNVTGFEGLAAFDNTVTNNMYAPVVLVTIFIIVLFVASSRRESNAISVAAFFTTLIGALFWALGLLSWYAEVICISVLVGSIILLSRE
jgi:hypothetical protein